MKIKCLKVIQNNVEFYIGKISFGDLSKISTVNHRIILGFDELDKPIYNDSFQRKVNSVRANDIRDYILMDEEATFPNSIILSVPSLLLKKEISSDEYTDIDIDEDGIDIESLDRPIYVQIIDGQHRFSGMKAAAKEMERLGEHDMLKKILDFDFVVSFFIDAQIEFQAMLFSSINRTPVKVPYDIVYDLFGLVDKDSPQKTALAICLELNSSKKDSKDKVSPFSRRIKLLGKKDKSESSYISQQIFIKTLITLICPSIRISETERFKDRDYFKAGGSFRTIFRRFYAENQDNYIYRTMANYFSAVADVFLDENGKSYWIIGDTADNPLQRTIGFLALVDVMIDLFQRGLSENRLDKDFFKFHLSKASKIVLIDGNSKSVYPYTSKGKTELTRDLLAMIE